MATTKKTTRRRKSKPPEPTGLTPGQTAARVPASVEALCSDIERDGGKALAPYRDPLGGRWLVLAVLPLELVEPTPYQRGLSDAHVKRLTNVIAKTGRFLDPVIAFRVERRRYQTPNGHHRASAMKQLGARSITALVVTEEEVARLILALNVEKAHNLREKSLEVIRLARHLQSLPGLREKDLTLEFDEPAFLTLGLSYEQRGRFAGGAYHPLLKRCDRFLNKLLPAALEEREGYAEQLLAIDDRVTELVQALKAQGLESPYLRNLVVARINPLRFRRGVKMPIGEALDKAGRAAQRFDPGKIGAADLARTGGVVSEA
ncbi:MAG: ParB N-terminal domain-containing protein [Acidiferrobacterales bacterium]